MARITPRPLPTQMLVLTCLNQRCPARRFRQDPDTYLQALEERWVKLSLPR